MKFVRYLEYAIKYKTIRIKTIKVRRRNERMKKRRKDLIAKEGKCNQCGKTENLTIDHIIPRSKGGVKHNLNNLQVLCTECNRYKADKIPQSTTSLIKKM